MYLFIYLFYSVPIVFMSPYHSTPPQPVPPPSSTSTLPLDFVLVSFIVAPIGEHYAKWNKPGGEGQIPYDLTFNQNIINNKKSKKI